MLFNSLEYAVFLPVTLGGYFLLPDRLRIAWLLAASCLFYMVYQPAYILVLAALIAIDYFAALRIEAARGKGGRSWLIASIAATCAVLFCFKYFTFFTGIRHSWALPVGLSFHTFQSLAYVIEVYRGNYRAERNPVVYATYVMFFPQLVAGPIERPQHLLPQFGESHRFDATEAAAGLKRIALGLFKKAVIADRLGQFTQVVFESPESYGGLELILAAMAFPYQIYCDFSGYTDMAIGSARLLGFRLMENFDSPFASRSVGEFWRRWHMSLSYWFRDYVFIPLGGNRGGGHWRVAVNYLITFALSGLWHGANWTFLAWGLVNGAAVVMERTLRPGLDRLGPLRIPLTFAFTCAAFVIFRAPNLGSAWYMLTHFGSNWRWYPEMYLGLLTPQQQWIAVLAIGAVELVQLESRSPAVRRMWLAVPGPLRAACLLAFCLSCPLLGVFLAQGSFIYFQF